VPIEAAPRPTVKWSVNNKTIESSSRVDIQIYNSQVIFEIPFSVRNDTGRYTLTLENNLGKCSASANVTVLGKIHLLFINNNVTRFSVHFHFRSLDDFFCFP
jgi:hypothetical protein